MLPHERLLEKGPESLSHTELLAVILQSGVPSNNVFQIADQILPYIIESKDTTVQELCHINGIGKRKAAKLIAIKELSKRLQTKKQFFSIKNAKDVFDYMKKEFFSSISEEFHVLFLNTKLEVIGSKKIFVGTLDQVSLHPREIFHFAVKYIAHSIIIVHNHPSGDPAPSEHDTLFTEQIVEMGQLMRIPVLDHIIIGDGIYYSFAESQKKK